MKDRYSTTPSPVNHSHSLLDAYGELEIGQLFVSASEAAALAKALSFYHRIKRLMVQSEEVPGLTYENFEEHAAADLAQMEKDVTLGVPILVPVADKS